MEIYTRHTLEHLTLAEANAALFDWYDALAVGGSVHIIVPYFPYHAQQLLQAEWTEDRLSEKWSDARWGFHSIFGWQRECEPGRPDYNTLYWDVHKSGYDEKLLTFLLRRVGFEDVAVAIEDQIHLVAKATKADAIARGKRLPEFSHTPVPKAKPADRRR